MENAPVNPRPPRWRWILGALVVLSALIAAAAVGFAMARAGYVREEASESSTSADVSSATAPPLEMAPVEEGLNMTGETLCPASDGTAPRVTRFQNPPPMCIDPSRDYVATVGTTKGRLEITLDAGRAPLTVNNFVVLARYHFYEGIPFHRIVPDFVVQAGDPLANGRGGPGYTLPDELPTEGEYQLGSVAMANSGPNTNGSQFFVVTGASGVSLPPLYSLFGQVTDGLEVVEAIERLGTPSGRPSDVVTITGITIRTA